MGLAILFYGRWAGFGLSEYANNYDKGGGSIDFLIPAKKWDVELLKNRSKLDELMGHFEQGLILHSPI